ncbi:hypothetical protein ACWCO9_27995, partial [Streptomyces sp. NPDC001937]
MDDKLRELLRTAAEAHRPDRQRMLARLERGMTAAPSARTPPAPRGPLPWLRVVGATTFEDSSRLDPDLYAAHGGS